MEFLSTHPVEIPLFLSYPMEFYDIMCQPYGISTLLTHTLWKFHCPQSKIPWNFRILRFNTP